MSIQDRVLMRKIKKREKQKLKLVQKKDAEKKEKVIEYLDQENVDKGVKRLSEDVDTGSVKKKKKRNKKKTDIDLEENDDKEEVEGFSEENDELPEDKGEEADISDSQLPGSSATLEILSSCTFDSLKDT